MRHIINVFRKKKRGAKTSGHYCLFFTFIVDLNSFCRTDYADDSFAFNLLLPILILLFGVTASYVAQQ